MEADDLSVVKIGLFRQVLCAEFKNQSAAVKKEYEAKAENERRMAESADPLEGAEREKCVPSLFMILSIHSFYSDWL